MPWILGLELLLVVPFHVEMIDHHVTPSVLAGSNVSEGRGECAAQGIRQVVADSGVVEDRWVWTTDSNNNETDRRRHIQTVVQAKGVHV